MPSETNPELLPSSFSSYEETLEVNEAKIKIRVLKMTSSTFIYIAPEDEEVFDEAGVAMLMANGTEVLGTTILGDQLGCESQELAVKLSKKLQKQVYVSCNVPFDRMLRPLMEKRLNTLIKEHSECF